MDKIYCMYQVGTTEIRYIGKTKGRLRDRLKQHRKEADSGKHSKKCEWLRIIGSGVRIRTLYKVVEGDWQDYERFFILKCKERGHRLLNMTEGGEGAVSGSGNYFAQNKFAGPFNGMYGKKHNEDALKKIAEVGKKNVGVRNGMYGKTHSVEVRERISNKLKGRKDPELVRKKKSEATRGRKNGFYGCTHNEETKRRIRELRQRPVLKFTLSGEFLEEFPSLLDAEETNSGNIGDCCRGKQRTAGGFIWKYK